MELAELVDGAASACRVTSALGPLKLQDLSKKDRKVAIADGVAALTEAVGKPGGSSLPGGRVVAGDRAARHGCGGTIRSMCCTNTG